MPSYDYACLNAKCGAVWEVFEPPSAKAGSCPKCRSRRVIRRIGSGSAILFSGGGWRSRAKAEQESAFRVSPKTANQQVEVPVEKGIVRKGRREDRPGTGRRGGHGQGNSKYVQGGIPSVKAG